MTMMRARLRAAALMFAAAGPGTGLTAPVPAMAQVQSVDPDQAIDGDLSTAPARSNDAPARSNDAPARRNDAPVAPAPADPGEPPSTPDTAPSSASSGPQPESGSGQAATRAADAVEGHGDTYHQDDLIGAATGVFGKGAKGIAGVIEGILKRQGEPNGYIVGREGGGAFIAGLRYGSGTLYHKLEGERPVYWTGPSIGFDAGANIGSAFVLVYNLYDTEELYKRFPAVEGRLYLVGGFAATYLRRGNVVLIPIRLGVGWRAGVNVGYMNITHKSRWLPF